MLYQLSYEATHWERGQLIGFISSREEWSDVKYIWNNIFLQKNLSSLSSTTAVQIWIISYTVYSIYFTLKYLSTGHKPDSGFVLFQSHFVNCFTLERNIYPLINEPVTGQGVKDENHGNSEEERMFYKSRAVRTVSCMKTPNCTLKTFIKK